MLTKRIRMSLLTALLTTVSLLSPITAEVILTTDSSLDRPMIPDPNNPGQTKPADRDIYHRTKCYCTRDDGAPEETHWEGAYFHVTYFNYRTSRLFSLEWVCKSNDVNGEFQDTECSPEQNMENFWRPGEFQFQGCVKGGDTSQYVSLDEWCYDAQRQFEHRDKSKFNRGSRKLELNGRSEFSCQDEVINECDRLCKEKVEPGMKALWYIQNPHEPIAECTIDTYEDVENM